MGRLADGLRSPRALLAPTILLSVAEGSVHGYVLMEMVEQMGLHRAAVYRELRALEEDGLVRSAWDKASRGPLKRTYEITPEGRAELVELASAAADLRLSLESFVARWARTVS